MSDFIAATLNVSYSPDEDSNNSGDGLSLERHFGFTGTAKGVPFRQYPPVYAKLVSSYGTISDLPQLHSITERQVVIFSGSKAAKLKRPQVTNVVTELVGGTAFNEKGEAIIPSISFNAEKQQLESNIAFYGAVKVSFDAPFFLYFYQFNVTSNIITGTIAYNDTIHAFYNKNHAELAMSIDYDIKNNVWLPLYTISSKIVLDEYGVWEYPKNWLDTDKENREKKQDDSSRKQRPDGEFPGWSNHKISPDNSFADERVHQTAEYDFLGRVRVSTPNEIISIQEPYWSTSQTFQSLAADGYIEFNMKFASKPKWKPSMKMDERQWIMAYLSINKDELYEELLYDYPNMKKEIS